MSTHDDDLLALLASEGQAQEDTPADVPRVIPITQGTLNLAAALCDVTKDVGKGSFEWYSFLLAEKGDKQCIARNLLVPKDQLARPGFIDVSGEAHAQANFELETLNRRRKNEHYIIGWLHSHADFPVGFSDEDARNSTRLINTVALNTQRRGLAKLDLIESQVVKEVRGDQVILTGQDLTDAVLTFTAPDETAFARLLEKYHLGQGRKERALDRAAFMADLLEVLTLRTDEPRLTGFLYSVTVNEKRETPYGVLGLLEKKPLTSAEKEPEPVFRSTPVQVVPVEKDVRVKKSDLYSLVQERITFQRYAPVRYRRGYPIVYYPQGKGTTPIYSPPYAGTYGYVPPATPFASTTEPQTVLKAPVTAVQPQELAEIFVYTAASYLARARFNPARYSQYMDAVLDLLKGYNSSLGLTAAVQEVGALYPDAQCIQIPSFRGYSITSATESITRHLPTDPNHPEFNFMYAASFGKFNAALQQYIPQLLAAEVPQPPAPQEPSEWEGYSD